MAASSSNNRLDAHEENRIDFISNAVFTHTAGYKCRLCDDGSMPLEYLANSYCDLLGYSQEEIIETFHDDYSRIVNTPDLKRFREQANQAVKTGEIVVAEHSVVHKNGSILIVNNSLIGKTDEKGAFIYGTVEDITDLRMKELELKRMNKLLIDYNEAAPFGIVELEFDTYPKVVYMNTHMLGLLGLNTSGRIPPEHYIGHNARITITEEDEELFDETIERALASDKPVPFTFKILKRSGQTLPVRGYAVGQIRPDGKRTVRASMFDVSAIENEEMRMRIRLCADVLGPAFDHLILLDTRLQSAQALLGKPLEWMGEDSYLTFSLGLTLDRWLDRYVDNDEEMEKLREFLDPVLSHPSTARPTERFPVKIARFRARGKSGRMIKIGLALIYLGDGKYLFAQYDATPIEESERVQKIIRLLDKRVERLRDLLFLVASGVIEFIDLGNNMFRIDHVEGIACKYFGMPEIHLMSDAHIEASMESLIKGSLLSTSEFQRLLKEGFVELGPSEGAQIRDRVRLSCLWNERLGLYHILLNEVSESHGGEIMSIHGVNAIPEKHDIYIRTFGHFEVFVDGEPVAFNHAKSKELLALLVDRRGGYVNSHEAISYLWEDEPADKTSLARYRKVAMRLKNILERYGISNIVETSGRSRRIDTKAIRCDLYDYLWGGKEYENLFKGSYILDYTWGEFTLSELINENYDRLPEIPAR